MSFLCMRRTTWTRTHGQTLHRGFSTVDLQRSINKPFQQYISTSLDPYLNLSIEHHLLQNTPAGSVVLFLYVNRPSIIIGRNQNPWSEVNLPLLSSTRNGIGDIDLVRRRSGGGTVFHDSGNVNWTIISPPAQFTRDKHAEMVVRALRECGVDRARVNERHDVVLDQGTKAIAVDEHDTHRTAYQVSGSVKSLKVSGSAYKLTKHRALHHGTCLLSSPNIASIGSLLRSPLKPYIIARGVESVSSPVDNIGISNTVFQQAVRTQFQALYPSQNDIYELEENIAELPSIRDGMEELLSPQWSFLQTPQFSITSSPEGFDGKLELIVRYGLITEAKLQVGGEDRWLHNDNLTGQAFHEIQDWSKVADSESWSALGSHEMVPNLSSLAAWFEEMLPRPHLIASR